MHNSLTDVSIVTMIGNLPEIINRNNKSVKDEFDYVFEYDDNGQNPKLKADVDSNSVTANTGYFQNLNFNGVVLNSSIAYNYNRIDASVADLDTRVTRLEEENSLYGAPVRTYGAVNESARTGDALREIDLSDLFSVKGDGSVACGSLDDIYSSRPFRTVSGHKIPLLIGTSQENGDIRLSLYHDHMAMGTAVQRIYVPIVWDAGHGCIRQAGPANSITLK
jgi:hypothetical protein